MYHVAFLSWQSNISVNYMNDYSKKMQFCVTKLLLKLFYEFLYEYYNCNRLAWASLVKNIVTESQLWVEVLNSFSVFDSEYFEVRFVMNGVKTKFVASS